MNEKSTVESASFEFNEEGSVIENIQSIKALDLSEDSKRFLCGYARRPDLRRRRSFEDSGPWTRIYTLISYSHEGKSYNACFKFCTYKQKFFLRYLLVPLSYLWGTLMGLFIRGVKNKKVGHIRITIDTLTDIDVFHWANLNGSPPEIYKESV